MTLDKLLKYIKEIEHRVNRTTPGPWIVEEECGNCGQIHIVEHRVTVEYGDYNSVVGGMREQILGCAKTHTKSTVQRDAYFLASARTDIPELAKQLKKLIKKYKKLKRNNK